MKDTILNTDFYPMGQQPPKEDFIPEIKIDRISGPTTISDDYKWLKQELEKDADSEVCK